MSETTFHTTIGKSVTARVVKRCLSTYLYENQRVWKHLPLSVRDLPLGRLYGAHLHALVRLYADRKQYFGTFFLRNRAELKLMCRLLRDKSQGEQVKLAVLACSKGAEVYSIIWAIRSARPDLKLNVHAVDISQEILEFAERGVYSRKGLGPLNASDLGAVADSDVAWNTYRDQNAPIFERMSDEEMELMCDVQGDEVRVKQWLKEGVSWVYGDARDPELIARIGSQEIVVANRFLCHMEPEAAEKCLRNVAGLVMPGGYLFVTGIDLDVRTRVARSMGWKPVKEMLREVHEGDTSLMQGWPLNYWGLEPFSAGRSDSAIRYASVFQIAQQVESA